MYVEHNNMEELLEAYKKVLGFGDQFLGFFYFIIMVAIVYCEITISIFSFMALVFISMSVEHTITWHCCKQ